MSKKKESPIVKVYYLSLVLLMLNSMKVCWLWHIPDLFFSFFSFILTIVVALTTDIFVKHDKKILIVVAVYLLSVFLTRFFSATINIGTIFVTIIHAFIIAFVIKLQNNKKNELFAFFCKILSVILIISIPAWILFLAGFPFVSGPVEDLGDGFHYIYNYKFFIVSYGASSSLYPRFASVFLEPGWIGTVCCFVLFGLRFNLKNKTTYLCLMGLLLSMSLSAIVNLVLCGILWILLNSKHKFAYSFLIFLMLSGITSFALYYNNGNNRINELILNRLVFDEDLGIAGNNRTTVDFDEYFEEVMSSSDRWFGMNYLITREFLETNSWFNHSSGIKKDIMMYGIIGTGLFMFFLFLLFYNYRSKECFIFVVCFLLASFVRNLWRTDCYLILFIVIMSCLQYNLVKNNLINNAGIIKK